jgi:hypothetical protein
MMRTIGAISDAHGLLRPQALAALAGCDPIIHAGDIGICSSSRPRVLIPVFLIHHRLRVLGPEHGKILLNTQCEEVPMK